MALEKIEFPSTGTPTSSFLPTRNPSYFSGPPLRTQLGVISQFSSGDDAYNYKVGRTVNFIRRQYTKLASSEADSYEAFRAAALGDLVKFTDYNGASHIGTFVDFTTETERSAGNRGTIEFEIREAI